MMHRAAFGSLRLPSLLQINDLQPVCIVFQVETTNVQQAMCGRQLLWCRRSLVLSTHHQAHVSGTTAGGSARETRSIWYDRTSGHLLDLTRPLSSSWLVVQRK